MDLEKIIKSLIEKKSLVLTMLVFLVFIVVAVAIFGGYSTKLKYFQDKINQKKDKANLIKEYDEIKKKYEFYIASIKKPLEPDALTNVIAEYGVQNNLELDINPQSPRKMDNYISTSIKIVTRTKNFKDMLLFVQMLEGAKEFFRVESLSAKVESLDRDDINFEMMVTSIQAKK